MVACLSDLKVIDLTRVLGGPYCTQLLADHGADVVKVEPPQGDEVRDWGPPFDEQGDAAYFIGLNRNKRSLGLDLTTEAGREVLLTLLAQADVLIENLKPGTLERWQLSPQALAERYPQLIHCRISGYGADGPLGGLPGYDAIVQAMTGWFSVNGTAESGPTRIGIPLVDMGTGLFAAIAILMALHERIRSKQGQFLDLTLFDCALALQHPYAANYFLSGTPPVSTGNTHPNISPYDRFHTATGPFYIGAGNNRAFQRLCEVIGRIDLVHDARFSDNGQRVQHRAALTAELARTLVDFDGETLCRDLLAVGVPAGPVLDLAQSVAQPHAQHRQMVTHLASGYCGTGIPIKCSRTPGAVQSPPPRFGEHGRDLLREFGFADAAIEQLIASGVVLEKRR